MNPFPGPHSILILDSVQYTRAMLFMKPLKRLVGKIVIAIAK
jgi:hypothetical protein